jgi:uncharacterized protein YjdB
LAAAVLLALGACSGDTAGPVTVASVQVQSAQTQVLPGGSLQLTATARDAAGKVLDRPVEWSSQHPALAGVDGSGRVTAIAPGGATIVARSGTASGELVVTVLPHPVASVTVAPDTATLAPGGTRQLAAATKDAGGNALTGRAVSWTSSNTAVATVDAGGVVTAHAEGTAAIRATSEGVQSAPAAVTVRTPIATLTIEPATARLTVGQKQAFAVTARDAAGRVLSGRAVTVATSAPAVVGLQGDTLYALAAGTATITAQAEGRTAAAEVTVVPAVASVTVAPETATLAPGGTRQLAAATKDAGGNALTGRAVSWTSSNTAVATVDAAGGVVTAHAEGTAGIIATSEGVQSAPAAVTVRTPIATLTLEPPAARLNVGQKQAFAVTARDAAGRVLSGRAVTVSSSAPAVVGLQGDTLHALAAGTATITAQAEGRTAAAEVTVVPAVASVAVSPASAMLAPGGTRQLTAAVKDAGGSDLANRAVTWHSTNTAVATVNAAGRVTAHADGTAGIIATSEGVQSAPAAVTVRTPIATLTIEPATARLTVGQKQAFAVTARDAAGQVLSGRAVTVSSSAPAVVGLQGDTLHALAAGTATITAQAEGRTATAEITVAIPVAFVTVSPDTATLAPGATRQLTATVWDASGNVLSGATVTWHTSSPTRATVDAQGKVTAQNMEGTAWIRAVSEGVQSPPAIITVRKPIASLSLMVASVQMMVDDRRSYSVTAYAADGQMLTGRPVTVTTSAPEVLAVTADSTFALSVGVATITARAEALSVSITVTVNRGPTLVGGIISTDTRWTRDASPYRLTSNVQVAYGATLTIDPGVTVEGAGRRLDAWGALHAVGTQALPIQLTGLNVGGRGEARKPFTLRMERTVMDGGSLYAPTGNEIYGSLVLRGCTLRDLSSYMYVWYPVADVVVEGNRFIRTGGISVGADMRTTPIRVYIRNNAFKDWTGLFAVENWASYGGEVMVVERNSFLDVGAPTLRLPAGYDDARMNAPSNWWGTTEEEVIGYMIEDSSDLLDAAGVIEFRPFLTAPDPGTPAPCRHFRWMTIAAWADLFPHGPRARWVDADADRTTVHASYRIRKTNGPHAELAELAEFSRAARCARDCIRGRDSPSGAATVSVRCFGPGALRTSREAAGTVDGGRRGRMPCEFFRDGCGSRAALHGTREQVVRTT